MKVLSISQNEKNMLSESFPSAVAIRKMYLKHGLEAADLARDIRRWINH